MNPNDIIIFFGKVVSAVMIIPIMAALIKWKYLDRKLKIFLAFCVISLAIALLEQLFLWSAKKYYHEFWKPILDYWEIKNTFFLQILAHVRDFVLLGWFFSTVLYPGKVYKLVGLISMILAIASIVNYIFIEGYKELGVFNPTADAIYCFIVPMIGMWYLYHNDSKIAMYKNPVFWISLGLILPNLMSLFLYFTSDFLQKEDYTLYVNLMLIKNFFEIIGIILITIGFAHAYYMRFFYPEPSK
ncbi:hypothetical protein [Haliscomenobacter sp.]|uniref:hypothetical protein n=1 Tax=Haliscomenobacter sp. TaxID=2717303 RepID=UPI003592F3C2